MPADYDSSLLLTTVVSHGASKRISCSCDSRLYASIAKRKRRPITSEQQQAKSVEYRSSSRNLNLIKSRSTSDNCTTKPLMSDQQQ
eukprot:2218034-Pleurochrysis_carterae.AAC.2